MKPFVTNALCVVEPISGFIYLFIFQPINSEMKHIYMLVCAVYINLVDVGHYIFEYYIFDPFIGAGDEGEGPVVSSSFWLSRLESS